MKRLFTGYFAKHGKHPLATAICVKRPHWLPTVGHCPLLAPSAGDLADYKNGVIDEVEYSRRYIAKLESQPFTAQDIVDQLPDGAVLLCYEAASNFCHRHVAADWLRRNARVTITEL